MVRESWLRTLRKAKKAVVEAIAETMAERTSKERKIIANEFDFRNYVTTEKDKIQKTTKRPSKG